MVKGESLVQLASRKDDKRLVAKFIQWWTGSIYSHCELVVEGVCYSASAMDGGVRKKVINLKPDKWDVIDLPWASSTSVITHFEKTDSNKYGWFALVLSQLFNRNREVKGTDFCSQWVPAALGLPSPASYSPETLQTLCVYLNEWQVA